MEIRKYNDSTAFGLTAKYSKEGDVARKAMADINPIATKAIDAGKAKFANITQSKGIKGEFCITDIIAQAKDNFLVKFFVKEGEKPTFSDEITINFEKDSMKKRDAMFGKQKPNKKSPHILMENITTKFMESYNKNKQV